jgi:large conductance mechanosensitive channel
VSAGPDGLLPVLQTQLPLELIVAFAIFLLIKQVNRLRGPKAAEPTIEKDCPFSRLSVPILASRSPHCTSALQPGLSA